MVEIIENVGDEQLLLQQKGKEAVTTEEEKRTQRLRVLVVDDNIVCLAVLTTQLKHCGFQVTPMREAVEALDLLRKNRNFIDIVLTDVIRFDLNGFQLLEIISHQFKTPVIMISTIEDERIKEEGKKCGARDYLVKPVKLEVLQSVCEQAVRNVLNNPAKTLTLIDENENPNTKLSQDNIDGDDDLEDDDEEEEKKNKRKKRKKKEERISTSSGESSSPVQKKPRVVWNARLEQKFLEAVLHLGIEKVVPMKILEVMNEPNLTRENVASHLQKFRNAVKKEREKLHRELAKNPRKAMEPFLNLTAQPTGLTINLHDYNNNFFNGNTNNFPQQTSLHSDGDARMEMSAVMGYPTINHGNQKRY